MTSPHLAAVAHHASAPASADASISNAARINAVVQELHVQRGVAIMRANDQTTAGDALSAAARAGFRILEVTMTTPGALELIADFAARPGLTIGAGTVMTCEQADLAVAAGASFLVSPITDPTVIARATELGVAAVPGAATPTELCAAHRAGAPLQKVFPAPAGGPAWIRSCLAPLPFLRLVPTNGVDASNCVDFLAAGAWAVGFAAVLFPPEELATRQLASIEERARDLRQRLESWPGRPAAAPPAVAVATATS